MQGSVIRWASNPLDDLRAEVKAKRVSVAELDKKRRALDKTLQEERAALATAENKLAISSNPSASKVTETAMRSLVKALGWRLTAGVVTFCTSFYFTGGDWATAGAIVGSDFLTKSGTMYIGERLFNKVQVGRTATGGESASRSILKALIWRGFAAVQTMIVSLFLIKKASVGAKIAGTDTIIKTTLMVFYDQAWAKVDWGRSLENLGGDGI